MKKILIVDDEQEILDAFTTLFSKGGYEVDTAQNGLECGVKLIQFNPDYLILDICMPEMNGMQVIDYIEEIALEGTQIIVISGFLDNRDIEQLDKKKIKWFKKPIDFKSLKEIIDE